MSTFIIAGLILAGFVGAGCSSLGTRNSDAVVELEAENEAEVSRIRQDVLSESKSWGAVRIGEESEDESGKSTLVFSLPGPNLDAALGSLGRVGAGEVSRTIDVDPEKLSRETPTTSSGSGSPPEAESNDIKLTVRITEARRAGPAFFRFLMAFFSVIGIVATFRWCRSSGRRWVHRLRDRWGGGDGPAPGDDRTDGPFHDAGDPPTQENEPARFQGEW